MTSKPSLRTLFLAASSAALLGLPGGHAEDQAAASLAQFAMAAETSSFVVDYSPIMTFSRAFGREEGGRMKIAYAAVEQEGDRFMMQYTDYLADVPVTELTRNDQLAFWLNTRNMLVMDAMADSRARRRMKRARGTFAEPGPMWTEKRITIDGVDLSIHDIEKDIILANFADNPNVIFGLYQGANGGPAFPADGFSAAGLDAELAEIASDYVNSRRGLKVRRAKAQMPAIYGWYGAAVFGGDQAAMRAHVADFATGSLATKLADATQFEARDFSYGSDELVLRQQVNTSTNTFGGARAGGGFGGGGGS